MGTADSAQRRRERAARLKAAGLCTHCGKNPARPGRATCAECAGASRAVQKARRDRCKASGVCTCCGAAPALPGRLMCAECRDKSRPDPAGSRERYAARKAAGLCPRCGKNPPAEGRAACTDCLGVVRRHGKKNYLKRKAEGLCGMCGKNPPRPGMETCAECAGKRADYYRDADACDGDCLNCRYDDCILAETRKDKATARAMEARGRRIEAGLCAVCGKAPASPGRKTCAECARAAADGARAMKHARKEAGLCTVCGKEPARPGRTLCAACARRAGGYQAARIERRKEAGLCTVCGKAPAAPGLTRCEACTERDRAAGARYRAGKEKKGYRVDPYGNRIPPKGHCRTCGAKLPEGEVGLCAECRANRKEAPDGRQEV